MRLICNYTMKIAFVGKGGSGKSTVSWLIASTLEKKGYNTLAIDADYNMDLAQNFGMDITTLPAIHSSERDFYQYLSLTESDYYVDLPDKDDLQNFSLEPIDTFTEKYSKRLSNKLRIMITGGVTPQQLYSHRCSHAFISPLKYYLPLLKLNKSEAVVIDSVAGTDLVSYGMFLGVDVIVAVVESTPQSIGVFHQIESIAQEFNIPLKIVFNKYRPNKHITEFAMTYQKEVLGTLPYSETIMDYSYENIEEDIKKMSDECCEKLLSLSSDSTLQWERHKQWKTKYTKQLHKSAEDPFQFVSKTTKDHIPT